MGHFYLDCSEGATAVTAASDIWPRTHRSTKEYAKFDNNGM